MTVWKTNVMVGGTQALAYQGGAGELVELEVRKMLADLLRDGPEIKPGYVYRVTMTLAETRREAEG